MFNRPSISTYYDAAIEEVKKALHDVADNQAVDRIPEEWIHSLIEKYGLSPIEFDGTRQEELIEESNGNWQFHIPVIRNETARVIVHYGLEADTFTINPATANLKYANGAFICRVGPDQNSIGHERSRITNQVRLWNDSIKSREPAFQQDIRRLVQQRIERARDAKQRLDALAEQAGIRVTRAGSKTSIEERLVPASRLPTQQASIQSHNKTTPREPRVFICYAKADEPLATTLYEQLARAGTDPWLDHKKLVLGDDFEREIKHAVANSDAFIACLRPGFDEIGFRQREVRWAIDAVGARPPDRGFIIPYVILPCALPSWCEKLHAGGDLSRPTRFDELLIAIEKHTKTKLRSQTP